ncbi:hypothetical protein BM43_3026 [Burkholderia gladioli]|uniref:Uncharacterized protein n=1 Tax=Burkholderia gladioli TaxID=28095 RepID=A0AAW3EU50_BURGA|nr:hypothetical protein [Burkholderia gladioli]AJW98884.1 hypothetical protein BM43_3026 [Burkholderia gladioli]ASD79000.1 hypothetical protein CEJ98_08250 [Burkholderia gladioli pv. gladioli]AWY55757.1 hypothetical protein A8H28_32900 [Burkholderia gladioli pv. gladioli]KGC10199.1 hypothetical protein DM48_5818 [Burkholderia gladioli]KGC10310.1 hypothetical protein DM48_5870 [Burkholderia gladioli]
MTTPLTDERRAALSSLITNWFSTLDADGALIREFDYFDVSKIDELIEQAIAPTIADAVECALAASSAAGAELPPFPTMLRKMWSGGDVQRWIDQNIAPLVRNAVPPAAGVPPHVRFSMESTARWLEGGCDPHAAAKEIRACLGKLDAAPTTPVAAAESPSLANACEVLRDAVAAKSILALGMVHGLASFAKVEAAPSTLVAAGVAQGACKGKNCGATDGISHSPECLAEYEAAVNGAVAADASRQDEPRLDNPAQVGGTRFGKGVKWSTVIGAAQRHFDFMQTPDNEARRIARAAELMAAVRDGAAVSPADDNATQLAEARQLLAHASEFAMMQLDEDWHERAAALLALPAPAVSTSAPPAHCQCPACSGGAAHASDCAVHNEPAMPRGPCDCAAGRGLYRKFDVRRLDGSSAPGGKHHGCEYFVLDLQHDAHAGASLAAYARSCSTTHPALSADLLARAAALGAPVAVDEWVSKVDALPAAPGWYLVMLAPDNDWELMSDTPIQVEFGAYKHMPQAFTHFYDGCPGEDITEAVTHWTRLPAPPRQAAPAAIEFSYALSQHAERWSGSFDSIVGALAEALSDLDDAGERGRVIWVGQNQPIDIDYDSLAEEVIERIQEQAFDQVGEVADVIGPYEETETKLLSLAIKRWIDEHGQIGCYRIDHSIAYGPGAPEYKAAVVRLRERDGSET